MHQRESIWLSGDASTIASREAAFAIDHRPKWTPQNNRSRHWRRPMRLSALRADDGTKTLACLPLRRMPAPIWQRFRNVMPVEKDSMKVIGLTKQFRRAQLPASIAGIVSTVPMDGIAEAALFRSSDYSSFVAGIKPCADGGRAEV
jgi:hypothetical protein